MIYHKNCPSGDGFGSAFAAWNKLGDTAGYLAADYGDELPSVKGLDVWILDLSFDAETMERLGREAGSLNLLDHHETARKRLGAFKPACCGKIHFDMGKAGCALAWSEFNPSVPMPKILEWVQDRDLWKWKLEGSKEFLSWLDTRPKTFEEWRSISEMSGAQLAAKMEMGAELSAAFEKHCQSMAASAYPVEVLGQKGLMANAGGDFRSRVGEILAQRSGTFGLVWRVSELGEVLVSLRSKDPYDVESIASAMGGGGHPTAASFKMNADALASLARGVVGARASKPRPKF